jgi:hypothetical protein
MFDDTPVADYTAVISKNGQVWRTISSGVFTDTPNESIANTYRVVSVNATLHGLTSIYVPTSFVVGGDGSSPISSSGSMQQLEDLAYLAELVVFVVQGLADFLLGIVTNSIAITIDTVYVLAGYQNSLSPGLIVIGSALSLPFFLGGWRASRRRKKSFNRSKNEVFYERGGLEVYSLMNVGKTKDGVCMVVEGVSKPCLLLEDYDGTVSERFKALIVSGERPTRLLRLYTEPISDKTDRLIIYGLILPPHLGT